MESTDLAEALAPIQRELAELRQVVAALWQRLEAPGPQLLSYRQAAAVLGISRNQIPALVRQRRLRVVTVGSSRRISRLELQRFQRQP